MKVGRRLSSKYRNKKTVVDGIKFDSKTEAEYYRLLKFQKLSGHIKNFRLQPKFLLQEAFKDNGKTYRKIEYKADFAVVLNDGSEKVVDVKGHQTSEFKLKAKMYRKQYGRLWLAKKEKGVFVEYEF